jgi:hypothetical protein
VLNIFNHREAVLHALRTGEGLPLLLRRMLAVSLGSSVLYGAVLGAQIGGWQIVSSPIKLPLILLGTGALCIMALYVLLALAGARLDWMQVVGFALCAICASAITMAACLPIAAFWTYCFREDQETLVTLTHASAFALSGWVGTRFGLEIAEELFSQRRMVRVVMAWMWVFGLVAQQMAWIFRPHFHATTVFMRPLTSGGSALETVFRILMPGF